VKIDAPRDTSNVGGYLVHRNYEYLAWISGPNDPFYNDTDVNPGHTYCYQIRSQSPAGVNSAPTEPYCYTFPGNAGPPPTPFIEFVGPNDNADEIVVKIDAPRDTSNIAGYLLHRNYQYLAWISGPNQPWYSDADVTPGERYCYQVRSQTPDGVNSEPTEPYCYTFPGDAGPPPTPFIEFVGSNDNGDAIVVSIDEPANTDNVAGYLVHRDYQYLAWIQGPDQPFYSDSAVTPGQTYCYQVRSQTPGGANSDPTEPYCYTYPG